MQLDLPSELGVPGWVDFFERSVEAQTVMRFAQRAGLTFAEAQVRLGLDQIHAETGWRIWESMHSSVACPSCGVDPATMDDEDGWSADEPMWKIVRRECAICYERHRAMKIEEGNESDDSGDRTAGVYYAVEAHAEGEPVAPRHALPDDD